LASSYTKNREALLGRLARVEGQVRGVARMVDDDAPCLEVLTQINAIKAALGRVGLMLLEAHIQGCLAKARPGQKDRLEEVVQAIARFAKT
jgi:CsoR family transcriptional regulator, copper-sensing transcriptional repressor